MKIEMYIEYTFTEMLLVELLPLRSKMSLFALSFLVSIAKY